MVAWAIVKYIDSENAEFKVPLTFYSTEKAAWDALDAFKKISDPFDCLDLDVVCCEVDDSQEVV